MTKTEMIKKIEDASHYSKKVNKEWKNYKELTTYYVNVYSNNNGYTLEDIYELACKVLDSKA